MYPIHVDLSGKLTWFLFECRNIIKNEFPKIKRKALLAELTDPVFLHDVNKRYGYKKTLLNEKVRNLV